VERYYDHINKRLVYIGKTLANNEFWDQRWQKSNIKDVFIHPPKHRFLVFMTKKYLPLHAKVLDGGCGMGGTVFALDLAGFEAYGIDFAQETVDLIQVNWPHLHISYGDVCSLPFADNFFDGYWSIGVIEHFYDGYEAILNEMSRVIKPGGYLFLDFPAMSLLRKRQAVKNQYPPFDEQAVNVGAFYQFALDPDEVRKTVEHRGFQFVKQYGRGALMGLKTEYKVFKPVARFLSNLPWGVWIKMNLLCDPILGNFSGHVCFLIFKNTKT
jgi:ubiquinone/menaquinone biosynthesis C-methylase UbiE